MSLDFVVKQLGYVDLNKDCDTDLNSARKQCLKLISDKGGEHLLIQKDSGLFLNGNGIDQTFKRASDAAVKNDGGPSRPAG